jgi:DNA-binding response OmpR family regulator
MVDALNGRRTGMSGILIVEDEAPLRRILTLNLVRRGYSVAEADSVASAEEAFRASGTAFDIILLDINLPDGSGWDVLRHLHLGPGTARPRVIVMTAVRPVQHRVDEFQPAALLLKPFPITALLQLVERELTQTEENGASLAELSAAENGAESAVGS